MYDLPDEQNTHKLLFPSHESHDRSLTLPEYVSRRTNQPVCRRCVGHRPKNQQSEGLLIHCQPTDPRRSSQWQCPCHRSRKGPPDEYRIAQKPAPEYPAIAVQYIFLSSILPPLVLRSHYTPNCRNKQPSAIRRSKAHCWEHARAPATGIPAAEARAPWDYLIFLLFTALDQSDQ